MLGTALFCGLIMIPKLLHFNNKDSYTVFILILQN